MTWRRHLWDHSPIGMHSSGLSLGAVLIVGISGVVTGAAVTARMALLFRARSI